MPRLDRLLPGLCIALALCASAGCNRLTFIKPNLSKMEVEQVRQPVVAHDSPAVRARISAQQQISAASGAFEQGDIAAAEKGARAALKADPQSVDAHTLMGIIAERAGRSQEAGGWFKKAAELSQGRPSEASNYGAWLCNQGNTVEALRYFDYAAQSQSGEERAGSLANAGTCALRGGLDTRAEPYLRQAIGLDPQNPLALESLAGLSLKQGQAMEARAFIERRIAIPPVTASVLSTASQIETRLGDSRAAALYRQRLQAEFPTSNPPSPGQ